MAIEMIHTKFGWSEYKNNDDKNCPTHKLLSNQEYDYMYSKIEDLYEQLKAEKEYVKQFREKAIMYKQNVDIQAKNKIEEANERVRAAEIERDHQIKLSSNLLRINKERNNAERKLQPKRDHSGYVVLQTIQKELNITTNGRTRPYSVWDTIIQTPYKSELTADLVRKQVDRDLTPKEGECLLRKLGIESIDGRDLGEQYKDIENKYKNIVYRKKLRINYRAGYWLVVYSHTKPIGCIPDEMR